MALMNVELQNNNVSTHTFKKQIHSITYVTAAQRVTCVQNFPGMPTSKRPSSSTAHGPPSKKRAVLKGQLAVSSRKPSGPTKGNRKVPVTSSQDVPGSSEDEGDIDNEFPIDLGDKSYENEKGDGVDVQGNPLPQKDPNGIMHSV